MARQKIPDEGMITTHIIVERGLRKPATYRETFEVLCEEGIIPSELADALSDLAVLKEFERVVRKLLQE